MCLGGQCCLPRGGGCLSHPTETQGEGRSNETVNAACCFRSPALQNVPCPHSTLVLSSQSPHRVRRPLVTVIRGNTDRGRFPSSPECQPLFLSQTQPVRRPRSLSKVRSA
ncbi:hypothetical protein DPEC_G00034030 [Dallia pectoralis]|uniref:Uncharacterized protein n=1 Tax=Dallia pectoralis TaxID=75939 RepID=A0ACC2HCX7_DALPE|nr:hypothetical protein DPEC_G00034030 [Dallia pectoralis]